MNRYEIAMGKKHSDVVLGKAKGQYDVPAGALKKCVLRSTDFEIDGLLMKFDVNNVVRQGYKVYLEVECRNLFQSPIVGEYFYLEMIGQKFKITPTQVSIGGVPCILRVEGNMPSDGVISTK